MYHRSLQYSIKKELRCQRMQCKDKNRLESVSINFKIDVLFAH